MKPCVSLRICCAVWCLWLVTTGMARADSVTEMLTLSDWKYGPRTIPVELTFPTQGQPPYALIIHQHGSSRDGYRFAGGQGQTDEHGTRMKQAALAKGFAFAALDAFYDTGISPSDKTRFPKAEAYASQLRAMLLAKHTSLDSNNTFYTGFSYGGDAVMNQLYAPLAPKWTALVAAEPSCNVVAEPQSTPYPVLILKGSESHYAPTPCDIVTQRHRAMGNLISLHVFQGGNHYFSLNGKKYNHGIAFNGCANNPIFIDPRTRTYQHHDGTYISRADVGKCFTKTSGGGRSRELLDEAISKTMAFFIEHTQP